MGQRHALFVPVVAQAHFFGMYRFALEIAKRGVTVTFVSFESALAIVRTFDELQGLDFNLISYEAFGSELPDVSLEDIQSSVGKELSTAKSRFQPVLEKLMADRNGGISGPTCIIGDRFVPWAIDAAEELNIPFYQFNSCMATFVRGLQALALLIADGSLVIKREPGGREYLEEYEGYLNIPGLPPLEYRDMVHPRPQGLFIDVVEIGRTVNKADAVIVNTFYEFEAPQIDAMQQVWKDVCPGKIPKLFLVGPVSSAANFKDRSLWDTKRGTASLEWLDGRPPLSVVYVCMGTVVSLSPELVEELAQALEASEQSFLWVVAGGAAAAIPPNFEARTRGRGSVVSGWVPQLQILQHPAVGGFVTHCGSNSVLESVCSGVPMACWPRRTNDQVLNTRYLVDVLKVAVEVRSTTPNNPKTQVGLEQAVRLLVSDEGSVLRARLQEIKEKAAAAVADGGNSKKALNDFVELIPS